MKSGLFTYLDSSPPPVAAGGPLAGKSIAIQSNMSVGGWPAGAGSRALERFVALEDATVVKRLRAAGATISGSTRMSELGLGLAGDTAARALAEGRVDIALVTDTMGEARLGATMIGALGFKPSYGLVSRFGLIGLVPSMECFGILATRPEELAAVLEAIAGSDERDLSMPELETPAFSPISESRESAMVLGVIREAARALEPGESRAFNAGLARLEQGGFRIEELGLADFDLSSVAHQVIGSVEASSSAGKYDGVRYGHRTASAKNWNEMYLRTRAESFGLLVKTYLFQGAYFQFENYAAFENACRIRRRLVRESEALFSQVGALILPARRTGFDARTAHTLNELYAAFSLTLLANVTGQPSLVVPGLVRDGGTDLGLQVIGPRLGDARLLSLAARLSALREGGG